MRGYLPSGTPSRRSVWCLLVSFSWLWWWRCTNVINMHLKWFIIRILMLASCLLLAFICHHNSFLIYNSLERPTLSNWSQVTHISVGSALIISAAFAVAGYTTFTGYTQGITKELTACTAYPTQVFPAFWIKTSSFIRFDFSGDIFENYCRDDNLATFGRFCFGLSIITTFPLECFVTREVNDLSEQAKLQM